MSSQFYVKWFIERDAKIGNSHLSPFRARWEGMSHNTLRLTKYKYKNKAYFPIIMEDVLNLWKLIWSSFATFVIMSRPFNLYWAIMIFFSNNPLFLIMLWFNILLVHHYQIVMKIQLKICDIKYLVLLLNWTILPIFHHLVSSF